MTKSFLAMRSDDWAGASAKRFDARAVTLG